MAKTNFTKVEEAFEEGLRKASVNRLLEITDDNAKIHPSSEKTKPLKASDRQLLVALKHELKHLKKLGLNPYLKCDINQEDLKKLFDNPKSITKQDWETLKGIREKVAKLKKELDEKTPNDDLVQQERDKHINKRFNVNEKWLPLT